MSVVLHVDGDAWRAHLRRTFEQTPGLVPVGKGNGYGFGLHRLARKSEWLGADTLAVGTYPEIAEVETRFSGSVLVLSPWRPFEEAPTDDPRVVHTVGRLADLHELASTGHRPRVVLELATRMRRHGLSPYELREASRLLSGVRLEGLSLHYPLTSATNDREAEEALTELVASGLPTTTVFVSHLTPLGLAGLQARWADLNIRPRIGTSLWLGVQDALSVSADVLDVHRVRRGDLFGYRNKRALRDGAIVVVSGGTAHGIGLEAPSHATGLRSRAVTLAKSGLEAAGMSRSPFVVGGRQRFFAEPPHMQVSLLFLSDGIPSVGDRARVRVRFTTATFDRTEIS